MNQAESKLFWRVQNSLQRLGCNDVSVSDLGDGHIQVIGVATRDESVLITAALRSVIGVERLTFESQEAGSVPTGQSKQARDKT